MLRDGLGGLSSSPEAYMLHRPDSVQGTHTERSHQQGPRGPGSLYRANNILTGAGRINRSLMAGGMGKRGAESTGIGEGHSGQRNEQGLRHEGFKEQGFLRTQSYVGSEQRSTGTE